jgi:hypothetical protein
VAQAKGEETVDAAWLDRYVDAWLLHALAGTPDGGGELQTLVKFFAPDATYEDVPSGLVFQGHNGVKEMCEGAHQWSSDLSIKVLTRQTDGSMYCFEAESVGTNTAPLGEIPATGQRFLLRTVSVGQVDDNELVREHRDYWDLGSFLTQIGILPSWR